MAGVLGGMLLAAALVPGTASADHRKGTYRDHGYVFFAEYRDQATLLFSSDHCNPNELGARRRIHDTTVDALWLRNRWPSGIWLTRQNCDGSGGTAIDIKLQYDPNFSSSHGNYGGENHSFLASRNWCEIFVTGNGYPCGYHPSVVHLNQDRLSRGEAYFERLIIHETGHSMGLAHHCVSDSIMNDGTSDCNGGKWSAINGYLNTDQEGINKLYPNWIY